MSPAPDDHTDPQLLVRAGAGPVDWSTPEGVADATRRFQAMAVAAEEMAAICRKLARTLTQDAPPPTEGKPPL